MKRLLATVGFDAKLQYRYGFYYAGIFVAGFWFAVLRVLPQESVAYLLPAFLIGNLITTTFFFAAALALLEKGQGVLEALVITPLRVPEYLSSKALNLTFLAVAESAAIAGFAMGFDFGVAQVLAGLILGSLFYTMAGFRAIAHYDSVTDFIFPSVLWILTFCLPMLGYFDVWDHWLLYLIPTQACLVLIEAGFKEMPTWEILYGAAYSLAAVVVSYRLARGRFMEFVMRRAGE